MSKKSILHRLWDQRQIQLMVVPGILFIILFYYVPMYGVIISFQDYHIGDPFFSFTSDIHWVGFKHFIDFITNPSFFQILRNTLVVSLLRIAIAFPAPIILALLFSEISGKIFKKSIQSISYIPHFVSWVIVAGLVYSFLSVDGTLNGVLMDLNIIKEPIMFMGEKNLFWYILIGSDMWKETGWCAILFLAAMAAIDPELYHVASIDGANRWEKIIHITLPGISSTMVIAFLFTIGCTLMYGFEPIMQLTNNLNNKQLLDTAEIIDTYVLRMGIHLGNYSYATAVGLFRSIISVVLLSGSNALSRRFLGSSMW